MLDLSEECLNVLNDGHFTVVEAGPLHRPIQSFSIRRDDKLRLILETEVPPNATSATVDLPPGTVRLSTERVLLRNIGGVDAELVGVIPFSLKSNTVGLTEKARQELAQVHIARTNYTGGEPAAYTFDWLENLPSSPFVWPASSRVVSTTQSSRAIALDDGITITRESEQFRSSNNTAKLNVEGWTFYICALNREHQAGAMKPGASCSTARQMAPSARRYERLCRSLWVFTWWTLEPPTTTATGVSSRRWPERLQPWATRVRHGTGAARPLGPRYLNELNPAQLTRAIAARVRAFEELDLANLSWAYWHACAATPHIAPAHFGAAIEALQNAYIKSRPGVVAETWCLAPSGRRFAQTRPEPSTARRSPTRPRRL